jgi:hypothetical protein
MRGLPKATEFALWRAARLAPVPTEELG